MVAVACLSENHCSLVPVYSSNTTNLFLPQGLGTCCSFCLGCFSLFLLSLLVHSSLGSCIREHFPAPLG